MEALTAEGSWYARLFLERGIALIYLVAFLSAVNQFRPLLGERGLLPVPDFLRRVPRFRDAPSVFHFHYSDRFALLVCWTGVILAAVTLVGLTEQAPLPVFIVVWLGMWMLYLSIVNVGQTWYGFGWESLLLEAGFLAIFLGPANTAPPLLVILLFQWLVFRLEFGAGLIKMRGDKCWRDLTCLYYHHETQPMPNPLSWYFHRIPKPLHRVEVAANHFTQLIVPFGLFAPQPIANVAAAIIIVTQSWLILSGNFSWLNAITVVLAFSALDDRFMSFLMPFDITTTNEISSFVAVCSVVLFVCIAYLSYRPVRNMLSRRQLMNASFNQFHLVNTYGAFGSVTKVRHEIIIEGTSDDALSGETVWREYEFKGKPGDVTRRPRQVAPYHLRLDWLMWFMALSPAYGREWFGTFITRLLENDRATLKLMGKNPFADAAPTYIRARFYQYEFTTWRERRDTKAYWKRTLVDELMPPVRGAARPSTTSSPPG
jgi:hypothetical protein